MKEKTLRQELVGLTHLIRRVNYIRRQYNKNNLTVDKALRDIWQANLAEEFNRDMITNVNLCLKYSNIRSWVDKRINQRVNRKLKQDAVYIKKNNRLILLAQNIDKVDFKEINGAYLLIVE
jgi:hypothetical protein